MFRSSEDGDSRQYRTVSGNTFDDVEQQEQQPPPQQIPRHTDDPDEHLLSM